MSTDKLDRVKGWWVLAGTLLFIAGALNIVYGIAAISDSKHFGANVTLIDALLTVGLAPIWTLCMFILALVVLYELAKSPDGA